MAFIDYYPLNNPSGFITSGQAGQFVGKVIQVACSDTSTPITVGSGKVTFRMPFPMTLTGASSSVAVPPGGTNIWIMARASGLPLFSTGLYIDVARLTSVGSATGVAISGLNAFMPYDVEVKADFLQVGSSTGGTEVVLTLLGI